LCCKDGIEDNNNGAIQLWGRDMKTIIPFLFFAIQTSSAYGSYCSQEAFFNCEDAVRFSEEATAIFTETTRILHRQKELAFYSANGAIGNTERSYLNEQYLALRDHIQTIGSQARFKDQFQRSWAFLESGLSFWTPIPIKGTDLSYQRSFQFAPVFDSISDYFDSDISTQSAAQDSLKPLDEALSRFRWARIETQEPKKLCQ